VPMSWVPAWTMARPSGSIRARAEDGCWRDGRVVVATP
jgi:hypothetical protein